MSVPILAQTHIVNAHLFGLNAHSVCANFSLNAQNLGYCVALVNVRKGMYIHLYLFSVLCSCDSLHGQNVHLRVG